MAHQPRCIPAKFLAAVWPGRAARTYLSNPVRRCMKRWPFRRFVVAAKLLKLQDFDRSLLTKKKQQN